MRSRSSGRPTGAQADLLRRLDLARGAPYRREALNARIDRYIADRRKAGFYEARLAMTAALTDGDRLANLTLTVTPGPHVRVVFTGDRSAGGQTRGARADRAGRFGRRRSAGGHDQRHRRPPAEPGISRRDGAAFAHRVRQRAGDRLRREARPRVPGRSGRNLRQCLGAVVRARDLAASPRWRAVRGSQARRGSGGDPGSLPAARLCRRQGAGGGRAASASTRARRSSRFASAWSSTKGCGRWCPRCASRATPRSPRRS